MHHPAFFDEVRRMTLVDPLAAFLGAAEGGFVEYTYRDAVNLAGHSCPTVAGAYLMILKSLEYLYPEAIPERGAIKVSFHEHLTTGVTGVMASIATLITGATLDSGFKGLGGRFDRRNLLSFNADITGEMRLERTDTGTAVIAAFHPECVPPAPAMRALMPLVLSGVAGDEEQKEFGRLWQDRVKRLLIDHADDPDLVVLTR